MKKTIALLMLVMLLLCSCTKKPQKIESSEPVPTVAPTGGSESSDISSDVSSSIIDEPSFSDIVITDEMVTSFAEIKVDLDCNGTDDIVTFSDEGEGDMFCVDIYPNGSEYPLSFNTETFYEFSGLITDLDPDDGMKDIIFCGDSASSDFVTTVLRLTSDGESLEWVKGYNEYEDDYLISIYQRFLGYENGVFTFGSAADVIGTLSGQKSYVYNPATKKIEEMADTLFYTNFFDESNMDEELLEFITVTAKKPVTISLYDEFDPLKEPTIDGEILPGEKVYVIAYTVGNRDGDTVLVRTESGRIAKIEGYVRDYESWGFSINGVDIEDIFENIMYAG